MIEYTVNTICLKKVQKTRVLREYLEKQKRIKKINKDLRESEENQQ